MSAYRDAGSKGENKLKAHKQWRQRGIGLHKLADFGNRAQVRVPGDQAKQETQLVDRGRISEDISHLHSQNYNALVGLGLCLGFG